MDTKTRPDYQVFKSPLAVEERAYRVEAIDSADRGEVVVATFSGPGARDQAVEFLARAWRVRDLLWSSLCDVTPPGEDHGHARSGGGAPRVAARGDSPTVLYGGFQTSPR